MAIREEIFKESKEKYGSSLFVLEQTGDGTGVYLNNLQLGTLVPSKEKGYTQLEFKKKHDWKDSPHAIFDIYLSYVAKFSEVDVAHEVFLVTDKFFYVVPAKSGERALWVSGKGAYWRNPNFVVRRNEGEPEGALTHSKVSADLYDRSSKDAWIGTPLARSGEAATLLHLPAAIERKKNLEFLFAPDGVAFNVRDVLSGRLFDIGEDGHVEYAFASEHYSSKAGTFRMLQRLQYKVKDIKAAKERYRLREEFKQKFPELVPGVDKQGRPTYVP
ncbi:MAG: hypothetical protein R3B54_00795 [Bdellovibrionota bacterium]